MTTCPRNGRNSALEVPPQRSAARGSLFGRVEIARRAAQFLADSALSGDRQARISAVLEELDLTGTYRLTDEELLYGLKQAWRNEPRCIRRGTFQSLERIETDDLAMIDLSRAKMTVSQVVSSFGHYLRYATNGGKLRPMIMVFPPDGPDGPRLRIWNDQLIRYAGRALPDGTTLGDPKHVELTTALRDLGWSAPIGSQTVLPVAFQIGDDDPMWTELPAEDILQVPLIHPDLPWVAELGMVWHALPAISRMIAVIGGLSYPVIFSGWYVVSEILENLHRYGVLRAFADHLEIDTRDRFWVNRVEVVALETIMASFREAGVMIEDGRSADANHHRFVQREQASHRPVRGDKSKLVLAGSTTDMHARADSLLPPDPDADPGFHYLPDAWQTESSAGVDRLVSFET
ncbi:nitric oxide synthase oxygenase [Amycolatopsis sp. NPDC059090]|uniref:nitric oxide synthase oxygenase n=1 Tax=unclassified Amycolatopsis TaxID=2618356 RepID=UPI003670A2C2